MRNKIFYKPEWAVFRKRTKHPPKSNVNAVLSFLYTVLGSKVRCAIELQGLDPMVGCLHELAYGRDALVYDLVEEFRTPVADAVCCSLFNLGILGPQDFRLYDFEQEVEVVGVQEVAEEGDSKGILLMESGMKKVLQRFEEKMVSEIVYGPEQRQMSYQEIIYAQAAHYKKVLLGETETYRSFAYR